MQYQATKAISAAAILIRCELHPLQQALQKSCHSLGAAGERSQAVRAARIAELLPLGIGRLLQHSIQPVAVKHAEALHCRIGWHANQPIVNQAINRVGHDKCLEEVIIKFGVDDRVILDRRVTGLPVSLHSSRSILFTTRLGLRSGIVNLFAQGKARALGEIRTFHHYGNIHQPVRIRSMNNCSGYMNATCSGS